MIKVTIQRNLIGLEDLLIGVGTVQQQRGPASLAPVTVTKINGSNLPYDADTSMQEKMDELLAIVDSLPVIVDPDGHMLTGLINTSNTNLNLAGRIWRKSISGTVAEIYYGTQLMFKYNPTSGNIVLPNNTDYIAADNVVIAAFQAADATITNNLNTLISTLKTAAYREVGVAANNVIALNADAKLPAVDGSLLTGINSIPIGSILYLPYANTDPNYMECAGQAINRIEYATLYAKIGVSFGTGDGSSTFNLPDIRGEFVRGWDNSRNVDAGRALGSIQGDIFKAHAHTKGSLALSIAGAHSHSMEGTQGTSGGTAQPHKESGSYAQLFTNANGDHTHTITGDVGSSGDSETRPRNIALQAIIRVK